MKNNNGFSLQEILVVTVMIGILATLSIRYYLPMRERDFDSQAKNNLKLLRSAQRIYKLNANLPTNFYYPYPNEVSETDIATINSDLGLQLSFDANRIWNYLVKDTGCVQATRNVVGGRSWYLTMADPDQEPDAGNCP